ncbi:hypothetical protein AJ79_02789 [Helicocarpus griseus UAMH5409]|uniref:Uncharacterized protein n=1 Tax=Helicocarpus griseus UAMH5409 TaxID=1447875 RepID=A0A2B7Y0D3_9EURO|nr:hypothetical protein AJ79_02789 [Helicocarpus griseus UAMH5409]
MPTDAEFEAFQQRPAEEDQQAFLKWSAQRSKGNFRKIVVSDVSTDELKRMIDNTNYNDQLQCAKLVAAVHKNVVPIIPVGTDADGDVYRISPEAFDLLAGKEPPQPCSGLVTSSVLGVNLNVQPRLPTCRRAANTSEDSVMSNESDDSPGTGFVFHQIGILERFLVTENRRPTEENLNKGQWFSTHYGVVVRFERSGNANGVYIICDYYPTDTHTGERPTERLDLTHIGSFGRSEIPMSVAKIAEKASDFTGFDRRFSPIVVVEQPIQLVRAVANRSNFIQRVTIMEDPRWKSF